MSFVFKTLFIFVALFAVFACSQAFDAKRTVLSGSDLQLSQTEMESTFTISLFNADGSSASSCGYSFDAELRSESDVLEVTCACEDGETVCKYTADNAGDYNLVVKYNDKMIAHVAVPVVSAISIPNCYATNITQHATTGITYTFEIISVDAKGLPTPLCLPPTQSWTIALLGGVNTNGNVLNCTAGVTYATYMSKNQGGYSMSIGAGGLLIQGSPYTLFFESDVPDPTQMEVVAASSTVAGANTTVTVQAENSFGSEIPTCGYAMTGTLTGSNGNIVPLTFLSCIAGINTLSYNATIAGAYTLNIFLNDVGINSNGKTITITPEIIADASKSLASGPGLTNSIVGIPSTVIISPYDRFGNVIDTCKGLDLSWSVYIYVDNQKSSGDVQSCFAGNITAVYVTQLSGNGLLHIAYGGVEIPNSPYVVSVVAGPIYAPTSVVTGPGITAASAGVNASVLVQAHDQFKNIILTCIPNPFAVYVVESGVSDSINSTFVACELGQYSYVYVLTNISTSYQVHVEYQEQPVASSPYTITVGPGNPSSKYCEFTGTGLNTSEAGVIAYYSVQCSDEFQNPISSCYPQSSWDSTLIGPVTYNVDFVNCTNGATTQDQSQTFFSYNATVAGDYTLDISLFNTTITTSDVTITHGPVFPAGSTADGPGVSFQNLTAGVSTHFYVYTADRFGNKIGVCTNDPIGTSMIANGKPITITVTNQGCQDGVTTLVYTPTIAGPYIIIITISGGQILGDPFSAGVIAAELSAPTIFAQGEGLTQAIAGENATFALTGNDAYGNQVNNCNSPVSNFMITLDGPGGAAVTGFVQCGSGVYVGIYNATVAGPYTMNITYSGADIKNPTATPFVSPAQINDLQSWASGPGFIDSSSPIAGVMTNFSVQAVDAFGNTIITCEKATSSYWTIAFVNPKGENSSQDDSECEAGIFTFYSTFTISGQYNVAIFGAVDNVRGSPSTFTVLPAGLDVNHSYMIIPEIVSIGENVTIYIQGADEFGNNVTACQNSTDYALWSITATDFDKITYGNFTGCSDGINTADIQIFQIGNYSVDVSFDGESISNSPVDIQVIYGELSYSNFHAFGNGVNENITENVAGTNVVFYVAAYNAFDYPIPACLPNGTSLNVEIQPSFSAYPENQKIYQSTCQQGVTHFQYNATTAGKFQVFITVDSDTNGTVNASFAATSYAAVSVPIAGSPYLVDIFAAEIDPEMTIVTGITSGSDNGTFYIQPQDTYGNNQTDLSPEHFLVQLAPFCAQHTYNQTVVDGMIKFDYTVAEGGIYCASITFFSTNTSTGIPINIKGSTIHAVGGTACGSRCSYKGYCFQDNVGSSNGTASYSCNCFQGWVADDCSVDFGKYPMTTGAIVGLVIGLSLLLFIIGLALGWCVIGRMMSKNDPDRSPLLSD